MFEDLKLSDLPNNNSVVLRKPSSTRPTLWVVEENGVRAIVKDFSANRFLYRNIVGRFLVLRESKAYRKLKNLKGVPTLYRIIDGLALVIEEIPGRDLENMELEKRLSPIFFDELKALVDRFHKRELVHCDLKRAPNTLLGTDGLPYVIDWGSSISKKEFSFFPLNLVYRRFLLDDYNAIIKLKRRHCPEAVTPEEMARYNRRSSLEKFIRIIRDRLREFMQKVA